VLRAGLGGADDYSRAATTATGPPLPSVHPQPLLELPRHALAGNIVETVVPRHFIASFRTRRMVRSSLRTADVGPSKAALIPRVSREQCVFLAVIVVLMANQGGIGQTYLRGVQWNSGVR